MSYYLGIDLGTSSLKCSIIDELGNLIKTCSRSYEIDIPQPHWAQQDPSIWVEAMYSCFFGLDSELQNVVGLGIAGQMHGLVILDENDQIIRPCILWNDGRTVEETSYLNRYHEELMVQETGNIAFHGFTAPKLLWLKEHEPGFFKRIRKVMLPKDYLVYVLTGSFVSDESDMSGTLFYDIKNHRYSKQMLNLCGIDETVLPNVYKSYEVIGDVKDEIKQKFGLLNDIYVIAGAGDNAAAAVSSNIRNTGQCTISLGTSGTVFLPLEAFQNQTNHAIHEFIDAFGNYHLLACTLSAGSSLKWFIEEILKDETCYDFNIPVNGQNEVIFLPYLMGERSPHNDAFAKGVFYGVGLNTTQEDMLLAAMEGVAFSLKDCIDIAFNYGVKIDSVVLCGGGAKSIVWQKVIANVLGLPVHIIDAQNGPSIGVARLAHYAVRRDETIFDVQITNTTYPEEESVKRYEQKHKLYQNLYHALKPVYKS